MSGLDEMGGQVGAAGDQNTLSYSVLLYGHHHHHHNHGVHLLHSRCGDHCGHEDPGSGRNLNEKVGEAAGAWSLATLACLVLPNGHHHHHHHHHDFHPHHAGPSRFL